MGKHNILAIIPLVILLASIGFSSSFWFDIDIGLAGQDVQEHIFSRVGNKAPSPLKVQCKSGDKDLGMQTVRKNHPYNFDFTVNNWGTTLYFCHFYWGQKQAVFDVWNNTMADYCRWPGIYSCHWDVRRDGFYLSRYPSDEVPGLTKFLKVHDWK